MARVSELGVLLVRFVVVSSVMVTARLSATMKYGQAGRLEGPSSWIARTAVDTAEEQGGPWTRVVLATNGRTNQWRSYPSLCEADSREG